jgi:hypothetical protein
MHLVWKVVTVQLTLMKLASHTRVRKKISRGYST